MGTLPPVLANGLPKPSRPEDEAMYDPILQLRDTVLAGKHPVFRLPPDAIERLKATLPLFSGADNDYRRGHANATAFQANGQQSQRYLNAAKPSPPAGLSGLNAPPTGQPDLQLDPIFKEKSDTLVRAEGQLKRQRLERDLQTHLDQRKHVSRDKDGGDGPSHFDLDSVLLDALDRVKPISGLVTTAKSAGTSASSFDENDYYSSQVQSEWSSDTSSRKASDKAAGVWTADFERLEGVVQPHASSVRQPPRPKEPVVPGPPFPYTSQNSVYQREPKEVYEIEDDDDDDYTPPDAATFDSFGDHAAVPEIRQDTPPDEDDNSEYEPGEITEDSNVPTPNDQLQQSNQQTPHVPVIRNHLTHIAAPQPNRVSPLATAKGPSLELELVNGRPEIVQKKHTYSRQGHSRASTASPSGNGVSGSGKKRRNKKRKRDNEPQGRQKRRREKQALVRSPITPMNHGTYIKAEPVSPPPFADVAETPQYNELSQYRPFEPEPPSPRSERPTQYPYETSRSGLRYEYGQPASPQIVSGAPPAAYRPIQRDTQDLRRVASLHRAQRPPSPPPRHYSPVAPYRAAALTYGNSAPMQQAGYGEHDASLQYAKPSGSDHVQTPRGEGSRSPPRISEYRGHFSGQPESPALMPPPIAPPRQIVVDQYGNRFYAAEPVPISAPLPVSRASVIPYERAPSRVQTAHPQQYYSSSPYVSEDHRVASGSAQPSRVAAGYAENFAYRNQDYNGRPPESARYAEVAASPAYQPMHGYEHMPPPPAQQEATPSAYTSRSYSVRPQELPQMSNNYVRQASMAPAQYTRQDPQQPARALSVMPGQDYSTPGQPHTQQYYAPVSYVGAPQTVRYVDQYGNEVHPSGVRMVSEFR